MNALVDPTINANYVPPPPPPPPLGDFEINDPAIILVQRAINCSIGKDSIGFSLNPNAAPFTPFSGKCQVLYGECQCASCGMVYPADETCSWCNGNYKEANFSCGTRHWQPAEGSFICTPGCQDYHNAIIDAQGFTVEPATHASGPVNVKNGGNFIGNFGNFIGNFIGYVRVMLGFPMALLIFIKKSCRNVSWLQTYGGAMGMWNGRFILFFMRIS